MGKKRENPVAEILATAANDRFARQVLGMAEDLNSRMKESADLGRRKDELAKLKKAGRDLMARRIMEIADEEKARLADEISRRKKQWIEESQKHITRRAYELEAAKVRYAAMSENELSEALSELSAAEYLPTEPTVVDALFAEARTTLDAGEVQASRDLVLRKNYRAPWLQNSEAAALEIERKAYETLKPYEVPIIQRENGRTVAAVIEIKDLLDEVAK